MKIKLFYYALAAFLIFALSGCSVQSGPQVRLAATRAQEDLCKLAVLPFLNETGRDTAAMQAYRIFSSELIGSGNYHVEPEGEVFFFLNRNRLKLGDTLNSQLYATLAQQIEVDAVIRGRVLELDYVKGAGGRTPRCALQVEIVSAEDGELLASTYHRRSGSDYQKVLHFGVIRTTSGLLAQVSREIIEAWEKKGLNHCPEK